MNADMPVSEAEIRNANANTVHVEARIQHIKHTGVGHEVRLTLPMSWRFFIAVIISGVTRKPMLLRVLIVDAAA